MNPQPNRYWNKAILINSENTKFLKQINPFFLPNATCKIKVQPFTILSLKTICIKNLHVNIAIKNNLKNNLRHYNYTKSRQFLNKLCIPKHLKLELLNLNSSCYLHGNNAFYEISCTRTNAFIYIQKYSALYNMLLAEKRFNEAELNMYFKRRTLFTLIRRKYSDLNLDDIIQKFANFLKYNIKFSNKII